MSTIVDADERSVHMANKYTLMHKDSPVAILNFNDNGTLAKVIQNNTELAPLGTRNSDKNFYKWWANRAMPSTRDGINAALNVLGVQNTDDLLVKNLGLSLNDTYWVKPYNETLSWADVNLYENNFSDVIGDFQFTVNENELLSLTGKTEFIPSTSQGELKKKWMIDQNDDRFLIKGNYGQSYRQSINEVYASTVHALQKKFPYTPYELTKIDTEYGKSLGCMSKNFTTTNLEFISAYDVCNSNPHLSDISEFQNFINVCKAHGLEDSYVKDFLEYQILSDFMITNVDRHFNNFGILRDTETLQFVDIAPIFDSGNSMFYNRIVGGQTNVLDIPVNSFRKKEHQLLEYVDDPKLFDLSKLPSEQDFINLYMNDTKDGNRNIEEVIKIYNKKIVMIDAFQHGFDIKEAAYTIRKEPFEKIFINFVKNPITQDMQTIADMVGDILENSEENVQCSYEQENEKDDYEFQEDGFDPADEE